MSQPGELRKQGIHACNLFYSADNRTQEQSMRGHDSPIHEDHAFIQLLCSLGPTRPELKILATFIKFCRKVYQNGKFLKAYIENVDGKFTRGHIESYYEKATNNLYELRLLFAQMIEFVHDIPPVLQEGQHEEVLDQLLLYFDASTGLHDRFINVIHFWVDRAAEILASSDLEENSENNDEQNSVVIDQPDIPGLDYGASKDLGRQGASSLRLTSDQFTSDQLTTASLAPQQTHQLTMTQLSTADRQDFTDKQTNRVTSGDILGGINTAGGGAGGGIFLKRMLRVDCRALKQLPYRILRTNCNWGVRRIF